jgi:hypothetical protein
MRQQKPITSRPVFLAVLVIVVVAALPAIAFSDACCPSGGGSLHTLNGSNEGYADCATLASNNEANLLSWVEGYCANGTCYKQYTQTTACTTTTGGWSSVSGKVDYRCNVCV